MLPILLIFKGQGWLVYWRDNSESPKEQFIESVLWRKFLLAAIYVLNSALNHFGVAISNDFIEHFLLYAFGKFIKIWVNFLYSLFFAVWGSFNFKFCIYWAGAYLNYRTFIERHEVSDVLFIIIQNNTYNKSPNWSSYWTWSITNLDLCGFAIPNCCMYILLSYDNNAAFQMWNQLWLALRLYVSQLFKLRLWFIKEPALKSCRYLRTVPQRRIVCGKMPKTTS